MQLCERSGANAIAVHLRSTRETWENQPHWADMARIWDAVNIPVIANGGFLSRRHISEFWRLSTGAGSSTGTTPECEDIPVDAGARGPAAIMIARGAIWNPAIFSSDTTDYSENIRHYISTALNVNGSLSNVKWTLKEMLNRAHACHGEV